MNAYGTVSRPLVSTYLAAIRAFRPLQQNQEVALSRNVQRGGCSASRDALIHSSLRFVVNIAKEYRNFGLPFEDLISDGNIGLIQAARRYDGSKGTRFVTYAIWWIRKSILQALDDQARTVRVPASRLRKLRRIREVEGEMHRSMRRKPTLEELALRLDRKPADVELDLQFEQSELRIDDPRSAADEQIADSLTSPGAEDTRDALIHCELLSVLNSALETLSEHQRTVIRLRFGLPDGPCRTLGEIASALNLSREGVRQIELRAKRKLRVYLKRKCRRSLSVKPR